MSACSYRYFQVICGSLREWTKTSNRMGLELTEEKCLQHLNFADRMAKMKIIYRYVFDCIENTGNGT